MQPKRRITTKSNALRYASRLERVKECMERYVSAMLVKGMLERTLSDRGLTYDTVRDSHVPRLVEDSMVGLRLFVDRDKLPSLMVELAGILED